MNANLPEWFLQLAHLGRDEGSPVSQLMGEWGRQAPAENIHQGEGGRGTHCGSPSSPPPGGYFHKVPTPLPSQAGQVSYNPQVG
jgi:hypothetical protein